MVAKTIFWASHFNFIFEMCFYLFGKIALGKSFIIRYKEKWCQMNVTIGLNNLD